MYWLQWRLFWIPTVGQRKITDFKKGLSEHIKNFKVKIEGEGTSEETFVAYISLKSVLQEKAQNMIMSDAGITGFLFDNKIKIIGRPYVEIINWNLESETIDFDSQNFGFNKRQLFDFQKEFRIMFSTTESNNHMRLNIGDIRNLCVVLNVDQFNEELEFKIETI